LKKKSNLGSLISGSERSLAGLCSCRFLARVTSNSPVSSTKVVGSSWIRIIFRYLCKRFCSGLYIRYMSVPPPFTIKKYFDVSLPTATILPTTISKVNTGQITCLTCFCALPEMEVTDIILAKVSRLCQLSSQRRGLLLGYTFLHPLGFCLMFVISKKKTIPTRVGMDLKILQKSIASPMDFYSL
jgi:hypothetical protein